MPAAYEELPRLPANHVALSPLSFLRRAAAVHPERPAIVHGSLRRSWAEVFERCRRGASALAARGVGLGDTVAILAPNVPAMVEAHFSVPATGAVLNALNYRLDAEAIAFILRHGEAKILLFDDEFAELASAALERVDEPPQALRIAAPDLDSEPTECDYEALLRDGDPEFPWTLPDDEWRAISLNYTSGTTGDPKGVVYHHRGAYLNALGNALTWGLRGHPTYLWTLPLFHCNGWCFPWTLAALAGTNVCLRHVRADAIREAVEEHGVTHLCGAPIVMQILLEAVGSERFDHPLEMMTAAAPPPAPVLAEMARKGIEVTHVYGLTETYGPAVVCAWKEEWNELDVERQAELKARQGVPYVCLEELVVADPETADPRPADGATMGEALFRGNNVMKGYLKNPAATEEAFRGGWFHSGDLGVCHEDGYLELRDRSKDIIISGGENISSIEVEGVLYGHPAVAAAAVVAEPDERWGETPCAFVELRPGKEASADELVAFCRDRLAHFKCPKRVVFGELPKTSTGKIRKFELRDRVRSG